MQARLVGMSFATVEGEAAYLPLGHHYADAPAQLPLADVLAKLKPWLESDPTASSARTSNTTPTSSPTTASRLAGIAEDTLLESYVLESDKAHDMDSLASRHLGLKTLTYAEVCGKGAKQIGFGEVELARATEYAAEDADITLRLHHNLAAATGGRAGPRRAVPRHRAAHRRVLYRDGTHRRADRRLPARPALRRARPPPARAGAAGPQLAGQPFNLGSPKQLARSCSTSSACRW
jgi:DNA polymerase-1